MQDPSLAVEGGQRWRGAMTRLELTQVVIFNNPALFAAGPLKQGMAARQAHRHAKRCLLARRHQRKSGVRRTRHPGSDLHPLLVDRHRNRPDPQRFHRAARQPESGIFQPGGFALKIHRQANQTHRACIATGNDDLLRLTAQTARHRQIGHQRLTQCQTATRIGIAGWPADLHSRLPLQDAQPDFGRECIAGGRPHLEGQRRRVKRLDPFRVRRKAPGIGAGRF